MKRSVGSVGIRSSVVVIMIVLIVQTGCFRSSGTSSGSSSSRSSETSGLKTGSAPLSVSVPVRAVLPQIRNVQLTQEFTGRTDAFSRVEIVPRIRGFLQSIEYTAGRIVKPGELLFKIQDFDYRINVDKSKAQLDGARAAAMSAEATYESALRTNQQVKGAVSENDIVQMKAKWDQALADVTYNQAQYKYNLQQLSYTNIVSPIRGKASRAIPSVGALLDGTGTNPPVLCTVVEMDPIFVYFEISDRQFDHALAEARKSFQKPKNSNNNDNDNDINSDSSNLGDNLIQNSDNKALGRKEYSPEILEANLADRSWAGEPIRFQMRLSDQADAPIYSGTIEYNENTVDMQTGTMTIRGTVPNPEYRIYPGNICFVRVNTKLLENAVVIQQQAICNDLTERFVWVINDRQEAQKRYIQPENLLPGGRERVIAAYTETTRLNSEGKPEVIPRGLKPNQYYVIEGIQRLREGVPVKNLNSAAGTDRQVLH